MISDLPELPDDSVRVIHLTHLNKIDEILSSGLSYKSQGMAMSTARAWSNVDQVQYSSDDPRFKGDDIRAIVMDLTNDEWKLHNNIGKAPGKIPPDKIIGIINPSENL